MPANYISVPVNNILAPAIVIEVPVNNILATVNHMVITANAI
jgi:hypothetical protein